MSSKRLYLIIALILFLSTSSLAEVGDIYTIAGNGKYDFWGDGGLATAASFKSPSGVTIDKENNLYIADTFNHRIRKIDKEGIITTIAGNGTAGYSGDKGAAIIASLNEPIGVCLDQKGNIYFSDSKNHRIRKIDKEGIITTIAGNGTAGYSGDKGAAINASLNLPYGIFIDNEENLYISDCANHRIRKIDKEGIITTIAGNGEEGYDGDNKDALSAKLRYPHGVIVDYPGDIYITHTCNSRVRKVNLQGIITTIAGNNVEGYSGDNLPAVDTSLKKPTEIFMDGLRNLYICDRENHRIRKIDKEGIITTIAGNGTAGFSGENGPAKGASLNYPYSLTMDSQGNFYLSDQANNRIRKIIGTSLNKAPVVTVVAPNGGETIKENFIIKWTHSDENLGDLHTFNILLSLDGGITYSATIASNLPDSTSTFVWDASKYRSNKAKIKIIVTDNGTPSLQGEDESDNTFILNNNLPPYIEITKPPAGETKVSGSYLICWDDLDPDDNATITLYWDKDQSWYNNLEDKKNITWGEIASDIREDDEEDSYLLNLSLIPSWCPWQRYFYVWGKIDDKVNTPNYDCSEGRVIIYTKAEVGGTTVGISGAMIEIGARALSEDAYVFVINNPEHPSIDIANYKVTQNPRLHLPKDLKESIHEFKAVGMRGDLLTTSNVNEAQITQTKEKTYITIPYKAEVRDQLKSSEDNLKIYYLNTEENNWEKISSEQILNKIKRTIKVNINKFGIYGILEEVPEGISKTNAISPYPNPLDLSKSGNYHINFGPLNNFKEIKIYNMAGELIETIHTTQWNIANKNYGSGVYFYLVFYEDGKVDRGKIAIIN